MQNCWSFISCGFGSFIALLPHQVLMSSPSCTASSLSPYILQTVPQFPLSCCLHKRLEALGWHQTSRSGAVEPHVAAFPATEALLSIPYLSPAANVCRTYRNLIIFRASTSLLNWIEISQWICKWLREKRSGRQCQHISFISLGEFPKNWTQENVKFWKV